METVPSSLLPAGASPCLSRELGSRARRPGLRSRVKPAEQSLDPPLPVFCPSRGAQQYLPPACWGPLGFTCAGIREVTRGSRRSVSPAFLLFPCLPASALVALGSEPSPLKLTAPDKGGRMCPGGVVSGLGGREGGRGSRQAHAVPRRAGARL